jgi:hypothetical protein
MESNDRPGTPVTSGSIAPLLPQKSDSRIDGKLDDAARAKIGHLGTNLPSIEHDVGSASDSDGQNLSAVMPVA